LVKTGGLFGFRVTSTAIAKAARAPAGVKIPLGRSREIVKAWHGQLAYDPAQVRAPVAIIRGEWDSLMRKVSASCFATTLHQCRDRKPS
jgi:hypothetical protein